MIYLDSCIVIYWVENHSVFAPLVEQRIMQATSAEFAISPLVMAEVLVMPFRENNTALIERYEDFFANCHVLPIPETAFVKTAQLRAMHTGL
jgi:predicted nucleic acid-binding protein